MIFRKIEQDNCFIIQQIDNKTYNFIRWGKKLFYLQFSLLRRTKLRISEDICYLRMTDIERIMTIFGQGYNLLNDNLIYRLKGKNKLVKRICVTAFLKLVSNLGTYKGWDVHKVTLKVWKEDRGWNVQWLTPYSL